MGESLQQERESPWALTLTDPVLEAFEFSPSDWPEKYFSGQSAKRNSRATLVSSYTRLFSLRGPFNGNIFEESFRKKKINTK